MELNDQWCSCKCCNQSPHITWAWTDGERVRKVPCARTCQTRAASCLPITLPVNYDGICIDAGYKLDLLVENAVIVELKATREGITDLHKAQLLTYLRLTGKRLGLIINFNVVHLKQGIKRMVLGELPYSAPAWDGKN